MSSIINIAEKIETAKPNVGKVALFYLGQAGFLMKGADGVTVLLDPYFSDEANRLFGFKRMSPTLTGWEKIETDIFCATHAHIDHLDTVSLPTFASCAKTFFLGAPDCVEAFRTAGIDPERSAILREGESWTGKGVKIRALYADHGELAPDANGLLVEIGGKKIAFTGDTAYRPEKFADSLHSEIDLLVAPINGQFGNMNADEACRMAELLRPKSVVACHFWMFLEHVAAGGIGDPVTFLANAPQLCPSVKPIVMAPGEMLEI